MELHFSESSSLYSCSLALATREICIRFGPMNLRLSTPWSHQTHHSRRQSKTVVEGLVGPNLPSLLNFSLLFDHWPCWTIAFQAHCRLGCEFGGAITKNRPQFSWYPHPVQLTPAAGCSLFPDFLWTLTWPPVPGLAENCLVTHNDLIIFQLRFVDAYFLSSSYDSVMSNSDNKFLIA